jgi:hypothetical protein
VEEVEEHVGYDLSGFDGLPMNKFEPLKKKKKSAADATQQERDLDEAGYAAEFERLEAQLGAGMSAVHEVPFTHKAAGPDQLAGGHRRGLSSAKAVNVEAVASEVAQKEAEKTGGIVATGERGLSFRTIISMVLTCGRNSSRSQWIIRRW